MMWAACVIGRRTAREWSLCARCFEIQSSVKKNRTRSGGMDSARLVVGERDCHEARADVETNSVRSWRSRTEQD